MTNFCALDALCKLGVLKNLNIRQSSRINRTILAPANIHELSLWKAGTIFTFFRNLNYGIKWQNVFPTANEPLRQDLLCGHLVLEPQFLAAPLFVSL